MDFQLVRVALLVALIQPLLGAVEVSQPDPEIIERTTENLYDKRIVGGLTTEPHSAPYIVTISLKGRQGNKQLCAGSIISENWIITAAHCLKNPAYRLVITAGQHSIENALPVAQKRRCDFYHRPESYSTIFGAMGGWDIGLAHVSVPFQFDDYVKPVLLYGDSNVSRSATIFGWGSTTTPDGGDFPDTLRSADLKIVDKKTCELAHNTTLKPGVICAVGAEMDSGACLGDSGGPLIQNSTLVGIVSWGPPTCDPKTGPTIFTNVGFYYQWILKKISKSIDENNLIN